MLKKNVDLHLNSHTWLSYKICESMKQKKIKGTVINFGSIYGLVGQNMSVYKKTKISKVTPTKEEIILNSRSRSAKLRVAERLH